MTKAEYVMQKYAGIGGLAAELPNMITKGVSKLKRGSKKIMDVVEEQGSKIITEYNNSRAATPPAATPPAATPPAATPPVVEQPPIPKTSPGSDEHVNNMGEDMKDHFRKNKAAWIAGGAGVAGGYFIGNRK